MVFSNSDSRSLAKPSNVTRNTDRVASPLWVSCSLSTDTTSPGKLEAQSLAIAPIFVNPFHQRASIEDKTLLPSPKSERQRNIDSQTMFLTPHRLRNVFPNTGQTFEIFLAIGFWCPSPIQQWHRTISDGALRRFLRHSTRSSLTFRGCSNVAGLTTEIGNPKWSSPNFRLPIL